MLHCPVMQHGQQFKKMKLSGFMCLRGSSLGRALVGKERELAGGWEFAGDEIKKRKRREIYREKYVFCLIISKCIQNVFYVISLEIINNYT